MGGWQHFINLIYEMSGGAGFSNQITPASRAGEDGDFTAVVLEGQLFLNVLIGSQSIGSVDEFVAAASSHAKDVIGFTNARRIIMCFDRKDHVTGAKKEEQKRRSDTAKKSMEAKNVKPYTEEELAKFFVRLNADGDGSAADAHLEMPKATQNDLPLLERLRASKGGYEVLSRAIQFIVDAFKATSFVHVDAAAGGGHMDARKSTELFFVYGDTVEHGKQVYSGYDDDDDGDGDGKWHWKPLEFDGTTPPEGVGEAEELVSHYALQERYTGSKVLVRCSDTDVMAILTLGLRRMRNKSRLIYLDMNQGRSLQKIFDSPEKEPEVESKKRKVNDYPRCVEIVEAVKNFLLACNVDQTFKNYADPLLTVSYVCCLGGSDNIPQLPRMSGAAWIKGIQKSPEAAKWLAGKAVFAENPYVIGSSLSSDPEDDFSSKLRTFVQEHGAVEEFVIHLFSMSLSADISKKYKEMSISLNNVPSSEEEMEKRLQDMIEDAKESLEKRQKKADKDYEKKLLKYEKEKANAPPSSSNEGSVAPDGTIFTSPSTKKRKNAADSGPKRTTSVAFIPIGLKEVRGRIRRAHWQLQKILNGVVENGTPPFDLMDGDKSVWGWDAETGLSTDDIVEWSNDVQLFK